MDPFKFRRQTFQAKRDVHLLFTESRLILPYNATASFDQQFPNMLTSRTN